MDSPSPFDVIVVGSGASGAMAASTLVESGVRVAIVDVGFDSPELRALVPDQPFSRIRQSDRQQHRYFLGDALEGVPRGHVRVGEQLTPPRQFITKGVDEYLPFQSESFFPMQTLALGGLAAGWGAACYTYGSRELQRMGIFDARFSQHYDEVAAEIGMSGDPEGDCAPFALEGVRALQPPLEIDTNHATLLRAYARRRARANAEGLYVDRMPLAVLSREHGRRSPSPYHDMDFWGEARGSVYRPRYTIEELRRRDNFTYLQGYLAIQFTEGEMGVSLRCRHLASNGFQTFRGQRLLLCAGAINSARLALNSLGLARVKTPILCNPYVYFASVHLRMLGRTANDARHSLAQLRGVFFPTDSPEDALSLQFYSYRSLLLFKLVKEIPLPVSTGLTVARILMNSLTIVGLHHPDEARADNWMQILSVDRDRLPDVQFHHQPPERVFRERRLRERRVLRCLRALGCLPVRRVDPGAASSIHYAGTIPVGAEPGRALATDERRCLVGFRRVYVGDSASWRFLPAKGLTLTLMANAKWVAHSLRREAGR